MSSEYNGSTVYFIENIQTVMTVQGNNAIVLKRIRDMTIMNNHAQYINRPGKIEILCSLPCHYHSIDYSVTISPGRDFNDFHDFTNFLLSLTSVIGHTLNYTLFQRRSKEKRQPDHKSSSFALACNNFHRPTMFVNNPFSNG
ncbi:hypothetical protein D3C78_1041220 [compost metagenome]